MTPEQTIVLLNVLVWPATAVFAICCAIGVAVWHLVPFGARARLEAAEARLAAHSEVLAQLGQVDTPELDRVRRVMRGLGA